MEYEYLIANSGQKLYSAEEIIEYINMVDEMLKEIRKTPKFTEEFLSGNLENYYAIEKSLQLKNPTGETLDNYEILGKLQSNEQMKR